jgi:UDP-N-acetylglucosamine transferase subunit ALG13
MTRAVDQWAGRIRSEEEVFAQIGPTTFVPQHMTSRSFLSLKEFAEIAALASVIVSHAGAGSILTALRLGKPIVIMPRRAALGEHRNEHQLATAARFRGRPGVIVAGDESELPSILDGVSNMQGSIPIQSFASPSLIAAVRDFIEFGQITNPQLSGELVDEIMVPTFTKHRQLQRNHVD